MAKARKAEHQELVNAFAPTERRHQKTVDVHAAGPLLKAGQSQLMKLVRSQWIDLHSKGTWRAWDPKLAGSAGASLNHCFATLNATSARTGRPTTELIPQAGTVESVLVSALTFPLGGGLVLDPKVVLTEGFFDPNGPIYLALPDFLAPRALTGRSRLPKTQLCRLFIPKAESCEQLSVQVAQLVEQVVWDLVEPRGITDTNAGGITGTEQDGSCAPVVVKATTRRQRKRIVAMRREAQAAALRDAAMNEGSALALPSDSLASFGPPGQGASPATAAAAAAAAARTACWRYRQHRWKRCCRRRRSSASHVEGAV